MHRSHTTLPSAPGEPVVLCAADASPAATAAATRVVHAFRRALERAFEAATRVEREPQAALHEFRRAVRGARALVAVCRRVLPSAGRLEIDVALRAATRVTGPMRDHDVLPEALAALPFDESTAEARAQLEGRLVNDRLARCRPLQRARRLAVVAAALRVLPDRFAQLVRSDLRRADLAAGCRDLAERARKSVKRARRDLRDTERLHDARKRLRTVAGALAQLASEVPGRSATARRLDRVSHDLGKTLDYGRLAARMRDAGIAHRSRAGSRLQRELERRALGRRRRLLKKARRALARRHWKLPA